MVKISSFISAVSFTVIAFFSTSTFAESRCENWAATLESAEGAVEWQAATEDGWLTAQPGFLFCYGDRVRILTQRAALRLANNTLVRLQEHSLITLLPEEKGFWVELVEGAGHFLSRTPKQFTIKAPYLNAAVDGTEFVVSTQIENNRVAVLEGSVRVSNEFGEVQLGDGMETYATLNTAPNPAQKIRLRDAAEWILYYPPLLALNPTSTTIENLIVEERYNNALDALIQNRLTVESATLAASLALNSGQAEKADQFLQVALEQNPQFADALALRALRTLIAGDSEGALSQTTELKQAHPKNPSVLLVRAYALQSQGEIENALEANKQALKLTPDNLFALARTAELQISAGNTSAARKLINRALQKAPQHSRVNTLAGFIALNRFATKEAQNYFQTAIDANNNEPLARFGLALTLIQKGKIEEGRKQMEMAALLDPSSSLLRSYLGKTYATQNQNDWADAQYQLAKNLDPNDPTPWFYQAHLKHEENKSGEALELITIAIEKNDNRSVYRSRMLLDSDAGARSANLTNIYKSIGFTESAKNTAALSAFDNPTDFASHQALITAYSDDPKAQLLRSREALKTRILAPIGAKELPVGLGEAGLQTYPWVSPGKSGAHEHSQLFAQRGLTGNVTSTVGSQGSYGYDWLLQGIGQNLSISVGQYDYRSDGYRDNNDTNIHIDESNLHYQITHNSKLFAQFLSTEEKSGDLDNHPESELFEENVRKARSSDRYLVGISHQVSDNSVAVITASKVHSNTSTSNKSLTETYSETYSTKSDPESDQFEVVYIGKIKSYAFQIGGYIQKHESDDDILATFSFPGISEFSVLTSTSRQSEYRSFYTGISSRSSNIISASANIGITDVSSIRTDKSSSEAPSLKTSSKKVNYKFGALLTPNRNLTVNLAHWKTIANRYPSHLSWGMIEPFYINTTEDLSNFAVQTASAAKFHFKHSEKTSVSLDFRDGRVIENSIIRKNGNLSPATDKIKTFDFGLNVEHLINPKVALVASSEFHHSTLDPTLVSHNVIYLTNYSNSAKVRFNYWRPASISFELTHLHQRLKTKNQSNPEYPSSEQELFANITFEFNRKNPNLSVRAALYNLLDTRSNFYQKSLTTQSESITPSQPLWPIERSAILNVTYQF